MGDPLIQYNDIPTSFCPLGNLTKNHWKSDMDCFVFLSISRLVGFLRTDAEQHLSFILRVRKLLFSRQKSNSCATHEIYKTNLSISARNPNQRQ